MSTKRTETKTYYHKNGQKAREGKFRDDKRHGRGTEWHENGKKDETLFYINGIKYDLLDCECKNEVTLYMNDFVFINNQIYHLCAICDEGEGLLWAKHINSTERAVISNKADAMVFQNEKLQIPNWRSC